MADLESSRCLIFTDLDGTLIDFETYSTERARPMVRELDKRGVQLIFCSSKTFAEQRVLQDAFGIAAPCIVENGSAIVTPSEFLKKPPVGAVKREGWDWLPLGMPAEEVRRRISKIEDEIGESLEGFGGLDAKSVARLTGLELASAKRAQARDFSETLSARKPESFWVELEPLFAKQGLRCLSGGRFRTVVSITCDKGKAARSLISALSEDRGRSDYLSIGIGDSRNDRDLLAATDLSYLVMKPGWGWHDIGLDDVKKVKGVGPEGWVKAIGSALASRGVELETTRY